MPLVARYAFITSGGRVLIFSQRDCITFSLHCFGLLLYLHHFEVCVEHLFVGIVNSLLVKGDRGRFDL